MATSRPPRDEALQEQEKLYNFLKKYDLQNHYSKFVRSGVHRLSHLKVVAGDDDSLKEIGLTKIEKDRLKTKIKENFSWRGRVVKRITGRGNQFNAPAPEVAHRTENEGRRAAAIIPIEEIKKIRKIGEGAHGAVYEGTWADEHGSVAVAIKTLFSNHGKLEQSIKEANSMSMLNHKHIIQLYGIVLSEPFMMVEELAPFGSLLEYVKKEGSKSSLKLLHAYVLQIADAMEYLESRRVVHRDLAIRNILLAHVDLIKLSDFGLARALSDESSEYKLSNMATKIPVAWTPLEALTHARFSTASDVWSYGVCVWEVFSLGKVPWHGLGPLQIMDKLTAGDRLGRPERCPSDVFDLVMECWAENPQDRPSFADVHRRMKMLPPKQVRATKSYSDRGDQSHLTYNNGELAAVGGHSNQNRLTFKNGDLIFIIDRPNPDWVYGMKANGSCGLVSADHISDVINPIDDIKAKVNAGAVNVSDIAIGTPTGVELMVHIRRDGSKWVSDNAHESEVKWAPPTTPTLLQTRVLDVRSPSPGQGPSATNATDAHGPFSPSSTTTDPRSPPGDLMRPESYLSPISVRPPDLSGNLGEDYRGVPTTSMDHLDLIMDRDFEDLDDLIGLDHHHDDDDNQAKTLDDQYVSMRRTVDIDALSPSHHTALGSESNESTSAAGLSQETHPQTLFDDGQTEQTQNTAKNKLSPYVAMQACSVRSLSSGSSAASREDLASSLSSSPKPNVKERSATVVSPSPLQPPQPLPRTRQRNNTTAALNSVLPDSVKNKASPVVPPRPGSGAAVAATTEAKRNSPAVPPRPLPKIRMNKPTSPLGELSGLSLADAGRSQESIDGIDLPMSAPPPLPPTPRDRMKEGLDSMMSVSSRRNSTGPLSSMFNESFVKSMVGENSPSFSHRNTPGIGDRSSMEVSDLTSPPVPSSPFKPRPPAGVPAHYDVPRSWTTNKTQEGQDLLDNDLDKASSSLLPLPLDPVPTPPQRPSRRHSAASLESSPSSSSLTPSSPSRAEKRASCSIPEKGEPVVPRRVRLFSTSPLTSPSKGPSSSSSSWTPDTSEGLLAVNPKYQDVSIKRNNQPVSSPDDSPELGSNTYATIPSREEASSSFSGSSTSPMSHYTVLSSVSTNPKQGSADKRANTLAYQPIRLQSVDEPHDYQPIIEFTGRSSMPRLSSQNRDKKKKDGDSPELLRYQPIITDTRVKAEDYTLLDSMNQPKGRSHIVLPVVPPPATSKANEAKPSLYEPVLNTNEIAKPTSKSKSRFAPPPSEDVKVDIDVIRAEMKLKVMRADEEFGSCDPDILKFALNHENYDVEHAKHYIRVQHLLGMLLPNITEEDCSKALLHCQQKVDRAALWLMEKSIEIEQGAH